MLGKIYYIIIKPSAIGRYVTFWNHYLEWKLIKFSSLSGMKVWEGLRKIK